MLEAMKMMLYPFLVTVMLTALINVKHLVTQGLQGTDSLITYLYASYLDKLLR